MSTATKVQVFLADNPSPLTGRGTNTYVVGQGDVVVIDPGPHDTVHLRRVADAVLHQGQAAAVLLTHHHLDHSDSAIAFARLLGVPLAAFPHPEAPALDRELADGDELPFGGGSLKAVHTPGHTRDHLCFWLAEDRTLFAGDLVAGEGFIVIDPPDGDMSQYLDSLRRARDLDPAVIRPGHGPEVKAAKAYLESYIAHRLQREAKVLGALGQDPRIVPQLLPVAYDDTPEAMYPIATRSLVAHLEKLVRDGRVEIISSGPEPAYKRKD
jgi:glyoxylase-like metal-dependent hydrolase (beta-lactamase superfamily II)